MTGAGIKEKNFDDLFVVETKLQVGDFFDGLFFLLMPGSIYLFIFFFGFDLI